MKLQITLNADSRHLMSVMKDSLIPIDVYDIDGTLIWANNAMLESGGAEASALRGELIGTYNLFGNPALPAAERVKAAMPRVCAGETVILKDDPSGLIFPVRDEAGQIRHFVSTIDVRKLCRERPEIERAKTYIEQNWAVAFDLNRVAHAAHLSKRHLQRLFKSYTGATPKEYHSNQKIIQLAKLLKHSELTIKEAFAACNVEYRSRSLQNFKKVFGVSPSEYRKNGGSK